MKTSYKPNRADQKLIRAAAQSSAEKQRISLRVGVMAHVEPSGDESINALLVAPTRDLAQTVDQISWSKFVSKGAPLTEAGAGVFDIAIYEMPHPVWGDADLITHVTILVEAGKLAGAEFYRPNAGRVKRIHVDGAWV